MEELVFKGELELVEKSLNNLGFELVSFGEDSWNFEKDGSKYQIEIKASE